MADAPEAQVVVADGSFAAGAGAAGAQGFRVGKRGIAQAASNICLAFLFFLALIPGIHHYANTFADYVWAIGAGLMGLLSLVRVPPKTVAINVGSISATAGMMIVPAMMQPSVAAVGTLYSVGVAVEIAGVVLTQVARLYLGRRFGLLPANRGIVSSGPFRVVRHPIYSGWLVLSIGFALIYPSLRNILVILTVLPFLVWRVAQEESLLKEDAGYRVYLERVHYRILPFIF